LTTSGGAPILGSHAEQGRELPRRHVEPAVGAGRRVWATVDRTFARGEPIMVYRGAMQLLATVTLSAAARAVAAGARGLAETSIVPAGEMAAAMGRAS
jgi:hypothetical protein